MEVIVVILILFIWLSLGFGTILFLSDFQDTPQDIKKFVYLLSMLFAPLIFFGGSAYIMLYYKSQIEVKKKEKN